MARKGEGPAARFARQWKPAANGCHEWTGAKWNSGYGYISIDGRHVGAHVFAWEQVNGPVPDGLEVHHECDNPPCVNEEHLEAITHRENLLRSSRTFAALNSQKTHCPEGHPLDAGNLDNNGTARGYRVCLLCRRARHMRHHHKNREKILARKRAKRAEKRVSI